MCCKLGFVSFCWYRPSFCVPFSFHWLNLHRLLTGYPNGFTQLLRTSLHAQGAEGIHIMWCAMLQREWKQATGSDQQQIVTCYKMLNLNIQVSLEKTDRKIICNISNIRLFVLILNKNDKKSLVSASQVGIFAVFFWYLNKLKNILCLHIKGKKRKWKKSLLALRDCHAYFHCFFL